MKIVAVSIVFAVCLLLTHANGRDQYMGMYPMIGKYNSSIVTTGAKMKVSQQRRLILGCS